LTDKELITIGANHLFDQQQLGADSPKTTGLQVRGLVKIRVPVMAALTQMNSQLGRSNNEMLIEIIIVKSVSICNTLSGPSWGLLSGRQLYVKNWKGVA